MALLALKETREAEDLRRLLLGWAAVLNELERHPEGPHVIDLVFRYLYAVRDNEEFARIDVSSLGLGKSSEAIMTRETYLINKGIEQGEQQGVQRLLLNQLRGKFELVPTTAVHRIEAADSDTLQRWGLRLLTADTLDEVFAA
jgi:hypothetical protein